MKKYNIQSNDEDEYLIFQETSNASKKLQLMK
jgi:hypothetical protein